MIKKYLLKIQGKIWTNAILLIILIIPILTFTLPLNAYAKGENITVLKLSKIKPKGITPYSLSISGNGEKIFYKDKSETKSKTIELFFLNLNTWKLSQLTEGKKNYYVPGTISLVSVNSNFDGSKIAFASDNLYTSSAESNSGRNICLYDLKTKNITQISDNNQYCLEPKISDDGSKLIFIDLVWFGADVSDNSATYYIYDKVSENLTKIAGPFIKSLSDLALSGDGTKVVYYSKSDATSETGYPLYELNLYDVETEKTELLQIKEDSNLHISNMSEDGKYFVFDSYPDVFLYNTDSKEIIQVTNTPSGESSNPQISANGKRGFFSSGYDFLNPAKQNKKNGLQIYMFNVEEKRVYEITKSKRCCSFGIQSSESVSADGKRLLAYSYNLGSGVNSKKNKYVYLIMLTNTRKAKLKIKQEKDKKDSFSVLIDYDFEDSTFDPLTNDIYAEVGTFTETLKTENFTGNEKGTVFRYTSPQDKKNGTYKMVLNKSKGVIKIRGNNLNLSETKYTFPILLKSTGLNVDEKLTVKKKKNQNNVKKLIFRADRKLGNGTSESVFP